MNTSPQIIQIESTPSTNQHLKDLVKQHQLPECSVVITHSQTEGRGQPGNSWESEPGQNLTFSLILYPTQIKISDQFIISKCISVAIAEVLANRLPEVSIKWPNDLYFKRQKIGGILIENVLKGTLIEQCIVGIGLNVNQQQFHSDAPNPISIRNITGTSTDLLELFKQLYESILEHYIEHLNQATDELEARYLHFLYQRTGWHLYRDQEGLFEACFDHIEPSGHLVLKRKEGTLSRYAFKEVSFMNR